MSEPRENEIVIEIDDEQVTQPEPIYDVSNNLMHDRDPVLSGNCDVYFFPIDKSLRSGFKPQRAGVMAHPALHNLDYIPGQRIHLDIAAKEGRITDALGDKNQEALRGLIARKWQQMEIISRMGQPAKDEVYGLGNDELLYTWMYWMRRLLAGHKLGRYVRPIQNVHLLPSLEEIIRSNKVRLPIYEPDVKFGIKGQFLTPEMAGLEVGQTKYEYGQEA